MLATERKLKSIILFLFILYLLSGCSFVTVRTYDEVRVKCTRSYVPPAIDTLFLVPPVLGLGVLPLLKDSGSICCGGGNGGGSGMSSGDLVMPGLVLTAIVAIFLKSASYGYENVSKCRKVR